MLTFVLNFLILGVVSSYNVTNTTNTSLIQPETNSRNFQLKGVAIGGWLVLEPYITPSLFLAFNATNGTENDIPLDEYRFCEKLGSEEAESRLKQHWDTFYNESDFATIKDMGLNMVRIPIGYWAFEKLNDDPYVQGAQDYLDKAIGWAEDNDLKVWVDLHGLPGSQNGFDNSGFRDLNYPPGWFNTTENIDLSYKVLRQIYSKYGGEKYKDTVIGIEVVNEPLSTKIPIKKITKFYDNTYNDARTIQEVNNTIIFHDAFKSIGYWNYDFSYSSNATTGYYSNTTNNTAYTNQTINYYNVMIDHHHYEVFDAGALNLTLKQHFDSIKGYSSSIKDELKYHPAVVGEWSAALTDCTPWLNGVGIGSRYEGTAPYTNRALGKCDDINDFTVWTEERKKGYRKFIEMQLDQYDANTNGWIFWCFKTETSIEWDLSRLVQLDLFPQPLTNRTYIINGTDTDSDAAKDDAKYISGGSIVGVPFLFFISLFIHFL